MTLPDQTRCPRCHAAFECRADDIQQCHCYAIQLTTEEKEFIAEKYDDCLCGNCLAEIKQRYKIFKG